MLSVSSDYKNRINFNNTIHHSAVLLKDNDNQQTTQNTHGNAQSSADNIQDWS